MLNPGYVHELAKLALEGAGDVGEVARRNGVRDEDLATATVALTDLSPTSRDELIHELYVADGREKGYLTAADEKTWVLSQRAHAFYDLR